MFDGMGSSCPDGPCTYTWSEDGTEAQPAEPLWPLGSGQALTVSFSSAGTKYVRLAVTDASGRVATSEQDVVVAASPPPPSAPSDIAPPTVRGTAQVGLTLTASRGKWSGSTPIAYTYRWQRDGTTNIPGADASTYVPVTEDVGHRLDVAVTATNSVGPVSVTSAQTAAITEATGPQTGCFGAPSACGYPDATNTGVPAGTELQAQSGTITVTTPGTTIKDLALNGTIEVKANDTTIEDSNITVNGTQQGCSSPCGGHAIRVYSEVTGTVIRHVTCHGGEASGENVANFCLKNEGGPTTTVSYVDGYNTAACFWGAGVYENDYCIVNGEIPEAHYEDIYDGGGDGELKMNHDTLFNPHDQTATVFASVDFGNQETITLTNNLLAGGGYAIYGGGSGQTEYKVLGPVTVTGNRFARCLTNSVPAEGGHHVCEGGPDAHGYYPGGGSYGLDAYFNEAVTTWSGNYWDDTLAQAPM